MCAYNVQLAPDELAWLQKFVKAGTHKAVEVMRAWVLLKSHEGKAAKVIHGEMGVTPKTVGKVRKRYCTEGLDGALFDKSRPGQPRKVTPEVEAQVTALACEAPPVGRKSITIARIQDQLKGRFYVQLSFGTVQGILKRHALRPWKKKRGAFRRSIRRLSRA